MPILDINKEALFSAIGRKYTKDEFEELCFDFGVELEEESCDAYKTAKEAGMAKDKLDQLWADTPDSDKLYRIDIPANRYDLLCFEGFTLSLCAFIDPSKRLPTLRVVERSGGALRLIVKSEVQAVRPHIVAAVLRGLTLSAHAFKQLMYYQEKLHMNICKKRQLVSIGVHDLDTVQGPFTYTAERPADVTFVPLRPADRAYSVPELLEVYRRDDMALKQYLHLLDGLERVPVVRDAQGVLLSLPPIINGKHTALAQTSKNMLIECTAMDLTKAQVVLNCLVSAFSQYCADPFTVEPVEVELPDGTVTSYPRAPQANKGPLHRSMKVGCEYLNRGIGINESPDRLALLCVRMGLEASVAASDIAGGELEVIVPPHRSDILHAVDVMEDVGIAYGYNRIVPTVPLQGIGAKQLPLNHLTDLMRQALAFAGYTEVLSFALCSRAENFAFLNHEDNGSAVVLHKPQSLEFEVARTTLLPGLFKTLAANNPPLPVRVFEVSDVVLIDGSGDTGTRNERRCAALYSDSTDGFGLIHGLVDRIMVSLGVPFKRADGYDIVEGKDPMYLPGRAVDLLYRGARIGSFGVAHPSVLHSFGVSFPCSVLELTLEPFV